MTAHALPLEYASWDTLRASMVLPKTQLQLLSEASREDVIEDPDEITTKPKEGKHFIGGYRQRVVHVAQPGELRFKDFVVEQSKKLHVSIAVVQSMVYAGKYTGLNKRTEGKAVFVRADAKLTEKGQA